MRGELAIAAVVFLMLFTTGIGAAGLVIGTPMDDDVDTIDDPTLEPPDTEEQSTGELLTCQNLDNTGIAAPAECIVDILYGIREVIARGINGLIVAFTSLLGGLGSIIRDFGNTVQNIEVKGVCGPNQNICLGSRIGGGITSIIEPIGWVVKELGKFVIFLADASEAVITFPINVINAIVDFGNSVFDLINDALSGLGDAIGVLLGGPTEIVQGFIDGIYAAVLQPIADILGVGDIGSSSEFVDDGIGGL